MSRKKSSRIIYDSSRGNGAFDEGFPPIEKVNFVYVNDEDEQTSAPKRRAPSGNVRNPERGAKFKQAVYQTPQQAPVSVPIKPAIKQSVQSTADFEKHSKRKGKKHH